MEFRLLNLDFLDFIFLIARWLLFCKKLHETQAPQSKFHEYIYIYIYIYKTGKTKHELNWFKFYFKVLS